MDTDGPALGPGASGDGRCAVLSGVRCVVLVLGFGGRVHVCIHCWVLTCPRCWGRKTNERSFCKECMFYRCKETWKKHLFSSREREGVHRGLIHPSSCLGAFAASTRAILLPVCFCLSLFSFFSGRF